MLRYYDTDGDRRKWVNVKCGLQNGGYVLKATKLGLGLGLCLCFMPFPQFPMPQSALQPCPRQSCWYKFGPLPYIYM